MTDNQYYKRAGVTILMIVLAVLSVLLLLTAARIFLLFFVAILIGIPLRHGGNFISNHLPLSSRSGVVITAVVFVIAIGAIGWYTAPQLIERTDELTQVAEETINSIQSELEEEAWGQYILQRIPDPENANLAGSTPNPLTAISSIFSITVEPIVTMVVLFILGLMFAFDPSMYQNLIIRALPNSKRPIAQKYFDQADNALAYWLLARSTSMVVIGVLTWIGLTLLGIPLALTLAILAGLLSFVPNIGPVLSAVPAVLVAFSQAPIQAVYIVLLYSFLQTIESYFITPYVEQKTVSLPPALTVFVQLVLTLLVGLVGAIVAAPLIVATMIGIKLVYFPFVLGKSEDDLDLHIGPHNTPS